MIQQSEYSEHALSTPLRFGSLVVENTTRCNAKCGMCYQSAGPKGSDLTGKNSLSSKTIFSVIEQAADIKEIGSRFHVSGGEAFIDLNQCLNSFGTAKRLNYSTISATTNAFWARNYNSARETCRKLSESGLNHLEISWDYWHQPFISPDAINNCILACNNENIWTNLRILTSKNHLLKEALDAISDNALGAVSEISSTPVSPIGRASTEVDENEIFFDDDLGANCSDVLNFTINPTGNVYPCCAGADQTESLSFGNVSQDSLKTIYNNMNSSTLLRILVFYGPGVFYGLLNPVNNNQSNSEQYSNICHMCWSIFRVKANYDKVSAIINERIS